MQRRDLVGDVDELVAALATQGAVGHPVAEAIAGRAGHAVAGALGEQRQRPGPAGAFAGIDEVGRKTPALAGLDGSVAIAADFGRLAQRRRQANAMPDDAHRALHGRRAAAAVADAYAGIELGFAVVARHQGVAGDVFLVVHAIAVDVRRGAEVRDRQRSDQTAIGVDVAAANAKAESLASRDIDR